MTSFCFSPASAAARPSETGPQSRVQVPAPVNASTLVASLGSFLRRVPRLLAAAFTSAVRPILRYIGTPTPPAMLARSSSSRQPQTGATRPSITVSSSLGKSSSGGFCSLFTEPVVHVTTPPPRGPPHGWTLSMSHYLGPESRISPSSVGSPLVRSPSPSVGSAFTAPVGPVCTPPGRSPHGFTLSMSHYLGPESRVGPLPLEGSSPSVGTVVTEPVGPVCTPPRLSPRAFTLSMSHYFESVPRASPSSSVRSASSGSPGSGSVSVSNLEDPFVDDAADPALASPTRPLVSPIRPPPDFEQLMAFADRQINLARAYTAKRRPAPVAVPAPRTPEPRTPEQRILRTPEPWTLSPMTSSPSVDAPIEESGSLFRDPVDPPCTPPPRTPPPREMDTLDRSVERQRLRARELSAEAKAKFAQIRALLSDWPAPQRRYAPSHDYSTDSPTPHTISNWDSTLEEDRVSEYSWTKGAFPVASPELPGALAEWDSPAASPVYSGSPVASSSGSVGSSGSAGSSGSSGSSGSHGSSGSTGSSGSGGSSGYCASPGSTGSFGTSSFFGSPGSSGSDEESGSISSLLELYGPRSPVPAPVPVPVPTPEPEFDLVTSTITTQPKGMKAVTLKITRRVPRVRS
ncbi:hypothetical protein CLIM01_10323 [Colletotrichum limetticola]|uniref:Uncharacterized protein n=1 Tax=Colletotrichum limetticola TaxID=1209924 RepID=A0ABQ9PKK0_9PEZI|nr:hypothetical protein CLIM01_10323 [Colletotrichum limetticola]